MKSTLKQMKVCHVHVLGAICIAIVVRLMHASLLQLIDNDCMHAWRCQFYRFVSDVNFRIPIPPHFSKRLSF